MMVKSIRRVTQDARHNAFTGACWFKGNLYVAYRQGDGHVCPYGRVVVLRSRDKGISWDHVAVIRGPADDTRDAHLYTDGIRLYVVSFIFDIAAYHALGSGCAYTEDGDIWTPWIPYKGTGSAILWRPQYFNGRHYCAAYLASEDYIHWFESNDGLRWKKRKTLFYSKKEKPNECSLEIREDGRATLLMRSEARGHHPWLWTSRYPFRKWSVKRLTDISITGPCCWTIENNVFIGCRWHLPGGACHTAIFKVKGRKTDLQLVLPSGPGSDHSYMGVARWPDNRHRFAVSFYSDAVASGDPALNQWNKPDIYLADILFGSVFLDAFQVSGVVKAADGLKQAQYPDAKTMKFQTVRTGEVSNFINVKEIIRGRGGLIYFLKDLDVGPCDEIRLLLGYDGPVKVWMNGQAVFEGEGSNPAKADTTSLKVKTLHGRNRLAIALDTNGGKAWGIFARWERV